MSATFKLREQASRTSLRAQLVVPVDFCFRFESESGRCSESWAKAGALPTGPGPRSDVTPDTAFRTQFADHFEWRRAMIKKVSGGYQVLSSKGRNMGGPYKTRDEALKRLRQVEFFKRHKG